MRLTFMVRFAMNVFAVVLFIAWYVGSQEFLELARIFPSSIAATAVVVAMAHLILDTRRSWRSGLVLTSQTAPASGPQAPVEVSGSARNLHEGDPGLDDADAAAARHFRLTAYYAAWCVGYVLAIWVLGLILATAGFLFLFLRREARMSLRACGLSIAVVLVVLTVMSEFMNLHWPSSLLTDNVEFLDRLLGGS